MLPLKAGQQDHRQGEGGNKFIELGLGADTEGRIDSRRAVDDGEGQETQYRHGQPLLKARQRLFSKQTQEGQTAEDHAHGAGLDGHSQKQQDGIDHHHEGIFPGEVTLRTAYLPGSGGNGDLFCMFSRGGGLGRRGGNFVFSRFFRAQSRSLLYESSRSKAGQSR